MLLFIIMFNFTLPFLFCSFLSSVILFNSRLSSHTRIFFHLDTFRKDSYTLAKEDMILFDSVLLRSRFGDISLDSCLYQTTLLTLYFLTSWSLHLRAFCGLYEWKSAIALAGVISFITIICDQIQSRNYII